MALPRRGPCRRVIDLGRLRTLERAARSEALMQMVGPEADHAGPVRDGCDSIGVASATGIGGRWADGDPVNCVPIQSQVSVARPAASGTRRFLKEDGVVEKIRRPIARIT